VTCFELSRTGFQPAENPNSEKPKLSLGGLRKPVVEVVIPEEHMAQNLLVQRGSALDGVRVEVNADVAEGLNVHCADDDLAIPDQTGNDGRPDSKPTRQSLPFTHIGGAIYPGDPTWTDPNGRAAALYHWREKIVFEVGRKFETKTERDAAEDFARTHRLSIANAFERRVVRTDVVNDTEVIIGF
jgi:hypothetical protein